MRTDTDIFDIGPFGWPPAVTLCHDVSATAWLNDPRLWAEGWRRYIGNLIPRGYRRYIRISHPAWIDPETVFRERCGISTVAA